MDENSRNHASTRGTGGQLSSDLLADPYRYHTDAKFIERSLRERWTKHGGVAPELKSLVLTRVEDALRKANDPRAVAALARVVVMIEGQAQADQHLVAKNARLDEGKPTEGVQQVSRVIIHAEPIRRRIDSKLVEGTPGPQETQQREMLEGPPPAVPLQLPKRPPIVADVVDGTE